MSFRQSERNTEFQNENGGIPQNRPAGCEKLKTPQKSFSNFKLGGNTRQKGGDTLHPEDLLNKSLHEKGIEMKYSRFFLITLLVFLFSLQLYSQGSFLEKGQSGLGVSGSFSSNKDASAIGGSGGYSVNGIFDFGLSVSKVSLVQKLAGQDFSATVISPFIALNAIKQNETTPISISIGGSYLDYKYSSTALDQSKLTMSASGYSVGVSIFGNITASPTMKVQPQAGVSYVSVEGELKDNYGNSITSESTSTIFDVGFSFLFQTSPTTIFGISPSLGIDKDYNTFGIRAGFVFIL